ncbi:MAG: hypothetical protein PVH61_15570 [Candidatus Aminicenantes bacterium]|jgi:hypothetical protein
MTGIKNRIGNACFLACLESFLQDFSIKVTQEEMVKKLLAKNLCSDDGVVYIGKERDVCKNFGILFDDIKTQFPVPEINERESILITTHKEQKFHCMRFFKNLTDEEKIIVMDPDFEGNSNLRYMDKKDFFDQDCKLHKICLDK